MENKNMALILLILAVSAVSAETITKVYQKDIYVKGEYSFSVIQIFEKEFSAGEPVPLPWHVIEYVYAETTGLEKIYFIKNNKVTFYDVNWLKQSKWDNFSLDNKLPMNIKLTSTGDFLTYMKHETTDKELSLNYDSLVWMGGGNWCDHNQSTCNPIQEDFAYVYTVVANVDCGVLPPGQREDCIERFYISNESSVGIREKLDIYDSGTVYITKIDLYDNSTSYGIDDFGVQAAINIFN